MGAVSTELVVLIVAISVNEHTHNVFLSPGLSCYVATIKILNAATAAVAIFCWARITPTMR